jgi:hypothetical protein
MGITYLSLFLSNLFRSILSSNCSLTFRLEQNLSSIPRFILSKKKFPLILPLLEHKALRSYLILSDPVYFLAQSFTSQVEYCTLQQQIYAQIFLFSSVPNNHSFRSQQQNHLLAHGQTRGSTLQQRTYKTLTTSPFGNTCEPNDVSPEVEVGGIVGLKCIQPSWDTDM